VTRYTEGFSHFVTSMTAPVASGWSVRRVGLAPTGKRRLVTAHAISGRSPTPLRLCRGFRRYQRRWKSDIIAHDNRTTYGTVVIRHAQDSPNLDHHGVAKSVATTR
jgi:hypothetical protein